MPGRQQIPSFQLPSGTTAERDYSYNLNTVGNIFYNTDTSNVEIRQVDPSNSLEWRDLVVNNREEIDISGYLTLARQPKLTNQPCFLAYNEPNYNPGTLYGGYPFPFRYTSINVDTCFTTSLGATLNEHYFTAPVNGIYRFTIKLTIDTHSSLSQRRYARPKIKKYNGSDWEDIEYYNSVANNEHSFDDILTLHLLPGTTSSLTWLQRLNSGDRIQLRVGQGTSMWTDDEIMFMGELAFAQ